jgi:hypothetical protein
MFSALLQSLTILPDVNAAFLSLASAVYDWTHLGCFTGSRISDYAQSSLPKGQAFANVPLVPEAGAWGGSPLAFIYTNFTLLDHHACLVPLSILAPAVAACHLAKVHIRFHFDKSPTNFTTRKFSATGDSIFDPPYAVASIILRAQHLGIQVSEPLGVYQQSANGSRRYLPDFHVTKVMHAACVQAYPDPTHYMRLHIREAR